MQLLGKVVDTPVVYNDRGHGPDSAVPGPGAVTKVVDTTVVYNDRGYGPVLLDKVVALCPLFLRQVHMVPDVRKRLEVPQMQFCVVGDVPVTMQRLWRC